MRASDRSLVDFSLVLNGVGVEEVAVYEPIWERLVALIDEYPILIEPDIDQFSPRSAATATP